MSKLDFSITTGYNPSKYIKLSWFFKESIMPDIITISDTVTLCPFCEGKLTRKVNEEGVLKTCPNGHEFLVNIIIINPEKEEE